MKNVDLDMVVRNEQWSTYYDVANRIVLHTITYMKVLRIDENNSDPDGIPLLWVEPQLATRVRRMTDEEFDECIKRLGKDYEIRLECKVAEQK